MRFILSNNFYAHGGCDKISDGHDQNTVQNIQLCTSKEGSLDLLGKKFWGFNATQHIDQNVGSKFLLDIDLRGDIAVVPSCDDSAHVYAHIVDSDTIIKTDKAPVGLKIYLNNAQGDKIPTVTRNNGGGITVNGNGKNVVIINNVVYVEGKVIEPLDPPKPIKTIVAVPEGASLKLVMSGDGVFTGKVTFDNASVSAQGNTTIDFSAIRAGINLTGSNSAKVSVLNGLDANITGASSLTANLTGLADVFAQITGSGRITTKGYAGNYNASITGSGSIVHSGKVDQKIQNVVGAGQISFEN